MNDKGEKTCPLCAEEMDWTDQHLKPCRCGYQICVYCWHHIVEMAEKEKTEGRCPACRSPYDKEKIVANCERLAAELNIDRKKSQKVKPNKPSSEGRKELTGFRVIQRNLVYVMGMPLDLADEDLCQRKDHFGQYGKVIKVAMSRTTAGTVQIFPNNTCSVYITYGKEEEAIRCIQSVHAFVLDGRPLKACFGTMKYCHAWLRNMPCNNAECLYLHEIGAPEDSFSKDETMSVHMRRIIQQITGAVDNSMRRSGSMLPPPVDDYVDNDSSTRKIPKVVSNNAHSAIKSSPLNGSDGQSVTLPAGALWGMHSSSQPSVQNTQCSREPLQVKGVTVSSAVPTNSMPISASHSEVVKKPALDDTHTAFGNALKPQELLDNQNDFPELSLSNRTHNSNSRAIVSASVDKGRAVSMSSDCVDFAEDASQSCRSMLSNGNKIANGREQSICGDAVSVDADSVVNGYHGQTRYDSLHSDHASIKSSCTEVSRDPLQRCAIETRDAQPLQEVTTGTALVSPLVTEADDDISVFNRQRLKDPEVLSCQPNVASKGGMLRTSNSMQPCSTQYMADYEETRTVFGSSSSDTRGINIAPISQGYNEMQFRETGLLNGSLNHSSLFHDKPTDTQGNPSSDIDDRIIANIMSLDLDDYLTLPHSVANLFGESDVEARSLKLASSSENNQSRFSFARQEESKNQAYDSYNGFNQVSHGSDFYQNSLERQTPNMDMRGMYTGFSSRGRDYVTENSSMPSSYKPPSIPRCPVSAPPGFSTPSRPPPPPGFASNGREQQTFTGYSGNQRLSDSSMFGNPYQSRSVENTGGVVRDVPFMDPAIVAVGQGFDNGSLDFRSNFQGNTNIYGNEVKHQQQRVTQNSLSSHQNCRFTGLNGGTMGMASRLPNQAQGNNILSRNLGLPNGHWDGLSHEIQGRNKLQNDRLVGSTNLMAGYNGTFRI